MRFMAWHGMAWPDHLTHLHTQPCREARQLGHGSYAVNEALHGRRSQLRQTGKVGQTQRYTQSVCAGEQHANALMGQQVVKHAKETSTTAESHLGIDEYQRRNVLGVVEREIQRRRASDAGAHHHRRPPDLCVHSDTTRHTPKTCNTWYLIAGRGLLTYPET